MIEGLFTGLGVLCILAITVATIYDKIAKKPITRESASGPGPTWKAKTDAVQSTGITTHWDSGRLNAAPGRAHLLAVAKAAFEYVEADKAYRGLAIMSSESLKAHVIRQNASDRLVSIVEELGIYEIGEDMPDDAASMLTCDDAAFTLTCNGSEEKYEYKENSKEKRGTATDFPI